MRMFGVSVLAILAALLAVAAPASPCRAEPAKEAKAADALVRATLLADAGVAVPGRSFTLGVRLAMKPHWHTYWVNPGEAGEATRIRMTGPPGFRFGQTLWPLPSTIEIPGGIAYGYEGEVLLLLPVEVAKDVPSGGKVTLAADVTWSACSGEKCVEGGAKLTIELTIGAEAKPANEEMFAAWRQKLPVPKDAGPAAAALAEVSQPAGGDGTPQPALAVRWKDASPRKVEWFPASTAAVAVEDVVVRHDGRETRIEFKPTVYKPDGVPGGRVDGVLVFEDAAGRRVGVVVPIRVPTGK